MSAEPDHPEQQKQKPRRIWVFLVFAALFIPVIAILEYYVMTPEYEHWYISLQLLAGTGTALALQLIHPRLAIRVFRIVAKLAIVYAIFYVTIYTLFADKGIQPKPMSPVLKMIPFIASIFFLPQRYRWSWRMVVLCIISWFAGGIVGAITVIKLNSQMQGISVSNYMMDFIGFSFMPALLALLINSFILSWKFRYRRVLAGLCLVGLFITSTGFPFFWKYIFMAEDWPGTQETLDVKGDDPKQLSAPFVDTPDQWQEVHSVEKAVLPVQCEMNLTPSTFRIWMFPERTHDLLDRDPLFANYHDAMVHARRKGWDLLPSTAMIHFKTKYFGERLLAALERHIQHQSAALGGGKAALFRALLERLNAEEQTDARTEVMTLLAAGLRLGGRELPELPEAVMKQSSLLEEAFNRQQDRSKAASFYAEDNELAAIFKQDRFLQEKMSESAAAAFAQTLLDAPELRKCYQIALALNACLCNPPLHFTPEDAAKYPELLQSPEELIMRLMDSEKGKRITRRYPDALENRAGFALLPFSTTRENEFFAAVYTGSDLPRENVMNRFIRALRAGEVSLAPQPDSGWYDYQSFAFEPLVIPERAQEHRKLLLDKEYKKHLIETFQVLITHEREKHLKIIPPGVLLGVPPEPFPDTFTIPLRMSVEPTATCYLRTGRAFSFLAQTLNDLLGGAEFRAIPFNDQKNVAEALDEAQRLCYGLYLRLCAEMGMEPDFDKIDLEDTDLASVLAAADTWLADIENDPAFKQDTRVAVPIMTDAFHVHSRYWMTVGVRFREMDLIYKDIPALRITEPGGEPFLIQEYQEAKNWFAERKCEFYAEHRHCYLPVEIFAEANGPATPLTRQEFRDLCDKYDTRDEIIAALAEYGSWRSTAKRALGPVAGMVLLAAVAVIWRRRVAGRTSPRI